MQNIIWRCLAIGVLVTGIQVSASAEESPSAEAIFAGGCFWCMEPPYDKLDGVESTVSGYTGGHIPNPTYPQVTEGNSGHYEAVKVTYDPSKVSYEKLLEVFWRNIDPLDDAGQFCDKGSSYRAAIFYLNAEQRQAAEASRRALEQSERFDQPIVTKILPASIFYPAEEYHQNYYQKNTVRYTIYRGGCGRDRRLEDLWGKQ